MFFRYTRRVIFNKFRLQIAKNIVGINVLINVYFGIMCLFIGEIIFYLGKCQRIIPLLLINALFVK